MSRRPQVDAIVPTIGASPVLEACLDALLAQLDVDLTVLLVEQRSVSDRVPTSVKRLQVPGTGFAAAANAGLRASAAPLAALVNDDAVTEQGWLAALTEAVLGDPELGAVQGTHLLGVGSVAAVPPGEPSRRLDGVGMAFNRWWQAVQIGHGQPVSPSTVRSRPAAGVHSFKDSWVEDSRAEVSCAEIFGVSATAGLYRRQALDEVARAVSVSNSGARGADVFDVSLESYYEDVDLAWRLRASGWRAGWVGAARVEHAGSASELASPGTAKQRLVTRNRVGVLARLLGRRFFVALPRILLRDLIDGARGGARGLTSTASAWSGALRRLPAAAHLGAPRVPIATLRRLGAEHATRMLIGGGR
jgi:hypothetical protein